MHHRLLIRIDGSSGAATWRYDSRGMLADGGYWFGAYYRTGNSGGNYTNPSLAVDQNGYVLVVETLQAPNVVGNGQTLGYSGASSLIKVDPGAGTPVASWNLSPATAIQTYVTCGLSNYAVNIISVPPNTSSISVGPDGSYYLEVDSFTWNEWVTVCGYQPGSISYAPTLLTVSPTGAGSFTSLPNCSAPVPSNVIPDGNGGALASSFCGNSDGTVSMQITPVGGSTASAVNMPVQQYSNQQDMVLGDEATYFTTGGSSNQVMDIDEASGNQLWSWQPTSGSVEIIAATAAGGVAVKNIITDSSGNEEEDVVRLDSNGNPKYDTWGTLGGSAAYGVLSNSSYSSNGLWVGTTGDPVISGIIGDDLLVALSPWGWGSGEGGAGGDEQGQAGADPALKLVGVSDCVTSAGSPAQFDRYPSYKLETGKNQAPSVNYTVFEVLSPHKQLAQCLDKKGNPTGSSPCNYASSSNGIPYNRFDDHLFVPAQTAAFSNNQSFQYGVAGQRLWDVRRIERTAQSLSTLQIEQVPTDNVDHLNLGFSPFQQPLIDGYPSPYLGPSCSSPPKYPQAK